MDRFYQQDLAYVHHTGFGEFARGAGEQILRLLRARQIESGLIVDLGCGSGIWASQLVQSGYRVTGIDISPAMIELASAQAPEARFIQGSVFDTELPHCQGITALGEVLGYGVEELPGNDQLRSLFEGMSARLPVGGPLLFDVIVAADSDSMDYRTWQAGSDWAVLIDCSEQKKLKQLTRRITLFRKVGEQYRRSEEQHLVRVFDPDLLICLLEAAGFSVSVSDCYGDFRIAPRRLAFLATKKPGYVARES